MRPRLTTPPVLTRGPALDNSSGRCIGPPRPARRDDSTRSTTKCPIRTSCRAPGRLSEPTVALPASMAKRSRPSRNGASQSSSPTSGVTRRVHCRRWRHDNSVYFLRFTSAERRPDGIDKDTRTCRQTEVSRPVCTGFDHPDRKATLPARTAPYLLLGGPSRMRPAAPLRGP